MPSITWSFSTYESENWNKGTSGNTYSLSSGGSTLPSEASVSSVTCSIKLHANYASVGNIWRVYYADVTNGPMYGSYSSDPSYTTSMANGEITKTISGLSMSGSDYSAFSSSSISVAVKANNNRSDSTTYIWGVTITVEYSESPGPEPPTPTPTINPPVLSICGASSYTGTFGKLTWSDASWSEGNPGTIKYRIKRDSTIVKDNATSGYYIPETYGAGTYYVEAYCTSPSASASSNSVVFSYVPITYPRDFKVNGSTDSTGRTAVFTWTASAISGTEGQGSTIYYELWDTDDGIPFISGITGTSYTYDPANPPDPQHGMSPGSHINFKLYAYTVSPIKIYSPDSITVKFTYDNRYISAPSLKISGTTSYTGNTIPLSWNTPASEGLSGDITYSIYVNNAVTPIRTVVNSTSLEITDRDTIKSYNNVSITITATRGGVTSGRSNAVTFTYYSPDKTVGYYVGSNTFVNCTVNYYDGSNWVKCDPYYYDGSRWVLCSTR